MDIGKKMRMCNFGLIKHYLLGDIPIWKDCMTMSMDDIFKSENCQTPLYFVCKINNSGRVLRFSKFLKI